MNDQPSVPASAADAAASRKPWRKPELTLLPVEETATSGSTGNDTNGATTGS